jgi:tRNA pseudouridine55 synthase
MTSPDASLDFVLPVDKPAGPTSHDIVAAARRAIGTRRIGHTGTLDPFASGLLLLCVNRGTRIAEYLSGMDKSYRATVRLGVTTDTDDRTGTITAERPVTGITQAAVEQALAGLRGPVLQQPPAYSAKKRGGERAYAAARQGRALDLDPVPVHIDVLQLIAFQPPELELEVACSSGTYIRAIARDLGVALGVGGHLAALRRTRVGDHDVAGAVSLDELGDAERRAAARLPLLRAVAHLPRAELAGAALEQLRHGRAVAAPAAAGAASMTAITAPPNVGAAAAPGAAATPGAAAAVAVTAAGELVAIAELAGGLLRPRKVLV